MMIKCALLCGLIAIAGSSASAEVLEFEDRAEWDSAVGAYTTIDFTGFPDDTIITDQYVGLGALFTDGNDFVQLNANLSLNDGAGLTGGGCDDIDIVFTHPRQWIAFDFPGAIWLTLYAEGEIFYSSDEFGGSGSGNFGGVISTMPFDAAKLEDVSDENVAVDDLHFGPPIPTPGALALFALTLIGPTRRRRT